MLSPTSSALSGQASKWQQLPPSQVSLSAVFELAARDPFTGPYFSHLVFLGVGQGHAGSLCLCHVHSRQSKGSPLPAMRPQDPDAVGFTSPASPITLFCFCFIFSCDIPSSQVSRSDALVTTKGQVLSSRSPGVTSVIAAFVLQALTWKC